MSWNFIRELRSQFGTKFTGCTLSGGQQGGEVNVWAYMKGFLKDFSKTDLCAHEFRQRSIIAPYMGMCALNARPLHELKVAIFTCLGDTFRGVPRREFLSRVENFWRMHRRSEKLSGGPLSGNGEAPNARMHAQACPLVNRPRLGDQKMELEETRLLVPTSCACVTFWPKKPG